MKPFPFNAAMFLLLGGFIAFVLGGWLMLAGVVMPLPRLSLVLLALVACLLCFQAAMHWGMIMRVPDIIIPQGTRQADQRHIILGVVAFIWAWCALCFGLLESVKTGYLCEGIGFAGFFVAERAMRRRGELPRGYLPIKVMLTTLVLFGLLAGVLSPQGRF